MAKKTVTITSEIIESNQPGTGETIPQFVLVFLLKILKLPLNNHWWLFPGEPV